LGLPLFAFSAAPPVAHATSSGQPDQFLYAEFVVNPGDVVSFGGTVVTWNTPVVIYNVVAAEDGTGNFSAHSYTEYLDDHAAVEARAGSTDETIVRANDPRGCCFGYFSQATIQGATPPGSKAYYAVASWGGVFAQHMEVNGVSVHLERGDPAHAFKLTAFDFAGGAAVAGSQTEFGALSTVNRNSEGLLLATMHPAVAGVMQATSPTGERFVALSSPAGSPGGTVTPSGDHLSEQIAESTSGVWQYSLDVEGSTFSDGAPLIVGVELPL
jgi:hypothetical protein